MPDTGKGIILVRYADAEADRTISGDDFEDDGKEGKICVAAINRAALEDGDEKRGEDEEPNVVSELLFDVFL